MSSTTKPDWVIRLGNRLVNPNVIDAVRSWFALGSGIATSLFAMAITIWFVWPWAWSVESEGSRIAALITALVLTHAEAILCLFYLHRVSLEALKIKAGAVEVNLDAQPIQQITVQSPQTVIQAAPNPGTTTVTTTETTDNGNTI